MKLDEVLEFAFLLSVYEKLLPPQQAEVLRLYYFDNIGLTEQAELKGITKQAIKDSLTKGEKALRSFEEKLGLAKIIEKAKNALPKKQFDDIFEKEEGGV